MEIDIKLAEIVAHTAHSAAGNLRKYTDDPYIVHPREVAEIVRAHGGSDDMIAAAFLHDVVEDTHIEIEYIEEVFGTRVADLVAWLTDVSVPEDGNRAARKALDCAHIADAPYKAQFVKCADIMSNTKSIFEHDPKFAEVYIPETRAVLEAMTKIHMTEIYMKMT